LENMCTLKYTFNSLFLSVQVTEYVKMQRFLILNYKYHTKHEGTLHYCYEANREHG